MIDGYLTAQKTSFKRDTLIGSSHEHKIRSGDGDADKHMLSIHRDMSITFFFSQQFRKQQIFSTFVIFLRYARQNEKRLHNVKTLFIRNNENAVRSPFAT